MTNPKKFDARQHMMDNAFEAFYNESTDLKEVISHQHGFYEIYMFESGDVTYQVGDKKYDLIPGDILLLPPWEPHHPIFNSWDIRYSRYVLWISELFIQNAKESCNCNFALPFDLISEHGVHLMRVDPAVRNELSQIVYRMVTQEDEPYSRALNNICLLSFLVQLNSVYSSYKMPSDLTGPFLAHLSRVVNYIVNNFDRPITLEEIADQCYLSKYHLAHEFKRTMGMTVFQYITMRRIYRARQMLLAGIKPSETAKRCGFSDYTVFYRAFVKKYGKSPKTIVPQKYTSYSNSIIQYDLSHLWLSN